MNRFWHRGLGASHRTVCRKVHMAVSALALALSSQPKDLFGADPVSTDPPKTLLDSGLLTFVVTGWGAVASPDILEAGGMLNLDQVINTPVSLWSDSSVAGLDGKWVSNAMEPVRAATQDFTTAHTVGISCGEFHTVLLKRDGSVVARGWNRSGQTSVPADLTNAVAIACGADHSLALRRNGSLTAWGFNRFGQCNVPSDLEPAKAVAAGTEHSLALLQNGRVSGWGANSWRQINPPRDLTDVTAVAAGNHHSLALRADGTVVGWGRNLEGQCDPPGDLGNIRAIAAGGNFSLALLSSGTVVGWGDDEHGQASPPPELTDVVAIAAGNYHGLALRRDGSVAAWGNSQFLSTEVPPTLSQVVAIAAGGFHSEALVQAVPTLTEFQIGKQAWTAELNLVAGTPYVLERSNNLTDWTPFDQGVSTPGEMTLRHPVDPNQGTQFWRINPTTYSEVRLLNR